MFCLMISGIYADDTGASTWKQGVASTTYGVALLPINVSYINENGISFEDTIFLPGLDIRLLPRGAEAGGPEVRGGWVEVRCGEP